MSTAGSPSSALLRLAVLSAALGLLLLVPGGPEDPDATDRASCRAVGGCDPLAEQIADLL